jgi:hypothetical protein
VRAAADVSLSDWRATWSLLLQRAPPGGVQAPPRLAGVLSGLAIALLEELLEELPELVYVAAARADDDVPAEPVNVRRTGVGGLLVATDRLPHGILT